MQVIFDLVHGIVNCIHRMMNFLHGIVDLGEDALYRVEPRKQQQKESGHALVMIPQHWTQKTYVLASAS